MDYSSSKHVELPNVMNKINHQILCTLLDYIYNADILYSNTTFLAHCITVTRFSSQRANLMDYDWPITAAVSTKWVTRCKMTQFLNFAAVMYQQYSLRMALWGLQYVEVIHSINNMYPFADKCFENSCRLKTRKRQRKRKACTIRLTYADITQALSCHCAFGHCSGKLLRIWNVYSPSSFRTSQNMQMHSS